MYKSITLNPEESQRASFLVSPSAEDNYAVQFDGLVGEFSAVTPLAQFAITNLTTAHAKVHSGSSLNIVVTIRNTGTVAGTCRIGDGSGLDFLVKTTPLLPLHHAIALVSGNNIVFYPGPTMPLPEALTNIGPDELNVFEVLWRQVNGDWLSFFFYDGYPAGELEELIQGEAYIVVVTEDCIWEIEDVTWREISLEPGESQDVFFVVKPVELGMYVVEVNDLTTQFECVPFDPWIYDTNDDGAVSKAEALVALQDYYNGLMTKEQVTEVIQLYYDGVKAALVLRFFAVTTPATGHGEFEIHCHIKNIKDYEVSDQFKLVGTMNVQYLQKEIDETIEFTLKPGEVHDYVYRDSTYEGDYVRVKVFSEWGWETPILQFVAGYFQYGVNLVATEIGADYVVLRYTRDEFCDTWDFGLKTDPAEQTISFPDLKISGHGWPTIYHLVTGLLPGRTYRAWCEGRNGGSMTGQTEFTTL